MLEEIPEFHLSFSSFSSVNTLPFPAYAVFHSHPQFRETSNYTHTN